MTVSTSPATRRTSLSASSKLRFLRFNRETKTTLRWETSFTRFRQNSDICRMKNSCRITSLKLGMTLIAFRCMDSRKSATMRDSTLMIRAEPTTTCKSRSQLSETKSREGKLRSSNSKETSKTKLITATHLGKTSMPQHLSYKKWRMKGLVTNSTLIVCANVLLKRSTKTARMISASKLLILISSSFKKELTNFKRLQKWEIMNWRKQTIALTQHMQT